MHLVTGFGKLTIEIPREWSLSRTSRNKVLDANLAAPGANSISKPDYLQKSLTTKLVFSTDTTLSAH